MPRSDNTNYPSKYTIGEISNSLPCAHLCMRVCVSVGRVEVGCVEALRVSKYREMRDVPIVRDTLES